MENPIIYWREWWRGLAVIERAVVIITLALGIFIVIVSQASAADEYTSTMNSIWTVLIVSLVTGTFSPALLLWMTNRNKRQERLETEAREDAREARADVQRALMIAGLETVKKQTDGVIAQVTELAKSTGHIEGTKEATRKAEDTAATLALGQAQGRDIERESIAAKTIVSDNKAPLPVADDLAAKIGERVALATEKSAEAAQRVANVAEEKKPTKGDSP